MEITEFIAYTISTIFVIVVIMSLFSIIKYFIKNKE